MEKYGDFFKKLRTKRDLTLMELSTNSGVSKSYLHDIENEKIVPSDKIVKKLLAYYKLDLTEEEKLKRILAFAKTPDIVKEELAKVKDKLDIMNTQIKKYERYRSIESNVDFVDNDEYKDLPVYSYARAGFTDFGNYPEPQEYLNIPLPSVKGDVVGIEVRGDSMEPKFQQGDILIVKIGIMPQNKEIGVFIVDNSTVVKVYNKDRNGRIILTSLNIEHEPIIVDEETEFHIVGKFWKAIVS